MDTFNFFSWPPQNTSVYRFDCCISMIVSNPTTQPLIFWMALWMEFPQGADRKPPGKYIPAGTGTLVQVNFIFDLQHGAVSSGKQQKVKCIPASSPLKEFRTREC
jgi:hypothetical protein